MTKIPSRTTLDSLVNMSTREDPPLTNGHWLMRGKKLPCPSILQTKLLTRQIVPLLVRQTRPKMPHAQNQPWTGHLGLPVRLLGQPLGAFLNPRPQRLVTRILLLVALPPLLLLVALPSLPLHRKR
jgi:hypothetical protein